MRYEVEILDPLVRLLDDRIDLGSEETTLEYLFVTALCCTGALGSPREVLDAAGMVTVIKLGEINLQETRT